MLSRRLQMLLKGPRPEGSEKFLAVGKKKSRFLVFLIQTNRANRLGLLTAPADVALSSTESHAHHDPPHGV